MPMSVDMTEFFDTDDFAMTVAMYGTDIDGIFRKAPAEALEMYGATHTFAFALSVKPGTMNQGDSVTIEGTTYRIIRVEDRRHAITDGITTIYLHDSS